MGFCMRSRKARYGLAGDRTRFFGFEARKDIHYPTSPELIVYLHSMRIILYGSLFIDNQDTH